MRVIYLNAPGQGIVVNRGIAPVRVRVCRYTRIRISTVTLINYSALARGVEVSESHSTVAESQASNSSIEKEAFAYMTNTPEETARRALNNKPRSRGTIRYDSRSTRIYQYPQADAHTIA